VVVVEVGRSSVRLPRGWRVLCPAAVAAKCRKGSTASAVPCWYYSHLCAPSPPLQCLRRGIWGTTKTWGRILTHKGEW